MSAAFDWDDEKNALNKRKHKIGFEAVSRFDWDMAVIYPDGREDYLELREQALGFIGDVLYYLVFTRRGETVRVISLRKAEKSERKRYVEEANRRWS